MMLCCFSLEKLDTLRAEGDRHSDRNIWRDVACQSTGSAFPANQMICLQRPSRLIPHGIAVFIASHKASCYLHGVTESTCTRTLSTGQPGFGSSTTVSPM
jgi:hypothetical protein